MHFMPHSSRAAFPNHEVKRGKHEYSPQRITRALRYTQPRTRNTPPVYGCVVVHFLNKRLTVVPTVMPQEHLSNRVSSRIMMGTTDARNLAITLLCLITSTVCAWVMAGTAPGIQLIQPAVGRGRRSPPQWWGAATAAALRAARAQSVCDAAQSVCDAAHSVCDAAHAPQPSRCIYGPTQRSF